jgi:hypothetical protein
MIRAALVIGMTTLVTPAVAQHRPQDMAMHERFYSTWMQPDHRDISCCHNQDCKPAASKFQFGHWWAKQEKDNEWVPIPDGKVEQERDSPDGRSHLCMRRNRIGQYSVYCFVRGAGT